MSSIKEFANNYLPKTIKNITELKAVDVSLVVFEDTATDINGDQYSYNYIEVNNEKYRIPAPVIAALKAILAKKPTLKSFSVTKQGEGKQTKYTVIPLD